MASFIGVVSGIGVVKEVTELVAGLYYNVTLIVAPARAPSGVGEWYRTPGQYVHLLREDSALDPVSFCIASAVPYIPGRYELALEFLIDQTTDDSAANELISSRSGDRVLISANAASTGFDLQKLEAPCMSVLMFASGNGLGSIRAYIETGFGAPKRMDARLYTIYSTNPPYEDKISEWEKTGVVVENFSGVEGVVKSFSNYVAPVPNLAKIVILLMVASKDEQEKITSYFIQHGVPQDQILTVFDGYDLVGKEKVARAPNKEYPSNGSKEHHFLPMGKPHVPFALKL